MVDVSPNSATQGNKPIKPTARKKRAGVKLSKQDALGILSSALNVLTDSGIAYTLGNNESGLAVVVHGVTINAEGTRLELKE
jgi:hypothetical protein